MGKKKKKKIAIGIIIIVITLSIFSAIYFFNPGSDDSLSVITMSISLIEEPVVLDFCSDLQECIDYYKENGMPDNFLEDNGYKINCQNGYCTIQK